MEKVKRRNLLKGGLAALALAGMNSISNLANARDAGYKVLYGKGSIEAHVNEVREIEIPVRDRQNRVLSLLPMDIFIYGNIKLDNQRYLYPGKTGYKTGDYTYINYEKRETVTHADALKYGKVDEVEAVQPELVIPVDGIILSFMKK